jgi:mannitol/fructose-specific phosphotransferase system IIA component (Ntr-type)
MTLDLPVEAIIDELSAKTKDEVLLAELSANIVSRITGVSFNVLPKAHKERELLGSKGIDDGVAIPMQSCRVLRTTTLCLSSGVVGKGG